MVELEQQLQAWTDAAVEGVEPVTTVEVVHGRVAWGPSRSRARSRRLILVGLAAAIVLVIAVGAAVGLRARRSGPGSVQAGAGSPAAQRWSRVALPVLGWTLDHPAAWRIQSYENQCMIGESGTLISNQPRPVRRSNEPDTCSAPPWDLAGRPEGFVGINLSHYVGGPSRAGGPALRSTELPLRFADFHRFGRDAELRIVIDNDNRYKISVYFGTHVSTNDRLAIERIVTSIRWRRRPSAMVPASDDNGHIVGYVRKDDLNAVPDGARPGVTVPEPPLDVFDKTGTKLLGHFYPDGVGFLSLAEEQRTGYGPRNPPPAKVTPTTAEG